MFVIVLQAQTRTPPDHDGPQTPLNHDGSKPSPDHAVEHRTPQAALATSTAPITITSAPTAAITTTTVPTAPITIPVATARTTPTVPTACFHTDNVHAGDNFVSLGSVVSKDRGSGKPAMMRFEPSSTTLQNLSESGTAAAAGRLYEGLRALEVERREYVHAFKYLILSARVTLIYTNTHNKQHRQQYLLIR